MKKNLVASFLLLYISSLIFSCQKAEIVNNTNSDATLLKRIINGNDTFVLPCTTCGGPVITRQEQWFTYDNLDRITQRLIIEKMIIDTTSTMDTLSVFNYTYNDNTARINAYSQKDKIGAEVMHVLSYDSQNRILLDSISNPQPGNNKLTRFTYLPGMIIQYNEEHTIAGGANAEVFIDSMAVSGNNIISEKIGGFYTLSNTYTVSSLINPLSYANNFSLLAADLKNGGQFSSFMIYTPQYITTNLTTQVNKSRISSSYIVTFSNVTVDSLNRVTSYYSDGNGKTTSFEYY